MSDENSNKGSYEATIQQVVSQGTGIGRTSGDLKQTNRAFYISLRDLKRERKELRSRSQSKYADIEQQLNGSKPSNAFKEACFEKVKDTEAKWKDIKSALNARAFTAAPSSPKSIPHFAFMGAEPNKKRDLNKGQFVEARKKSGRLSYPEQKGGKKHEDVEDSIESTVSRPRAISPFKPLTATKKNTFVLASGSISINTAMISKSPVRSPSFKQNVALYDVY